MNYRLLNQGEVIQEGDELFQAGPCSWKEYPSDIGISHQGLTPIRRPIPETKGWIPVSTPPKKEDADPKTGLVLWWDGHHAVSGHIHFKANATHWKKLDLPEDPEEEDFRTWWEENASMSSGVDFAREAFLAGRKSIQS